MTEDEIRNETPEDEVEAHGLKETAAGMSAAAMLAAGAGTAAAANPAASANAKPATHPTTKMFKRGESVNKLQKKGEATVKLNKIENVRADATQKADRSE